MSKKIHVRPSGEQSKVGFAGVITYTHWRNGFTDKKIASKVIEIEDGEDGTINVTSHQGFGTTYTVDRTERSNGSDIENRLKSLQSLYDQRLITREEYEEKKQEILKEL